jgi:hypothetical protein
LITLKILYWPFLLLSLISIYLQVRADDRWEEFKTEFQKSNYYLETERIQNFTCYITTDAYLKFSEHSEDSVHHYPLKFVWMKGDKTFFILQPYENMNNEQKNREVLEQIKNIKSEFQEFFYYWQLTAINSPVNNVADSAEFRFTSDSMMISYLLEDSNEEQKILKIFSSTGPLEKLQISSEEQTVIVRPEYLKLKDKNICNGWRTQIFQDSLVIEEIITRLELETIGSFQLPKRVELDILPPETSFQEKRSVIFIGGFEFDLPFLEIKAPD